MSVGHSTKEKIKNPLNVLMWAWWWPYKV